MKVSRPGSPSLCLVQAGLSGFKARAPVRCVCVSGFGCPPLSSPAYLWPEPGPVQQPETERRGGIEWRITPVHSYALRTWLTHIRSIDKEMELSPMISYQKVWVLGCRVGHFPSLLSVLTTLSLSVCLFFICPVITVWRHLFQGHGPGFTLNNWLKLNAVF